MSKDKIGVYITTLSEEYMKKIVIASLIATSAISFLDEETLLAAWKKAVQMNVA